jgi:hypothetical protein
MAESLPKDTPDTKGDKLLRRKVNSSHGPAVISAFSYLAASAGMSKTICCRYYTTPDHTSARYLDYYRAELSLRRQPTRQVGLSVAASFLEKKIILQIIYSITSTELDTGQSYTSCWKLPVNLTPQRAHSTCQRGCKSLE